MKRVITVQVTSMLGRALIEPLRLRIPFRTAIYKETTNAHCSDRYYKGRSKR